MAKELFIKKKKTLSSNADTARWKEKENKKKDNAERKTKKKKRGERRHKLREAGKRYSPFVLRDVAVPSPPVAHEIFLFFFSKH